MNRRVFALIDCNNFFVSCERAFRPDLENVPVAVLSNNDGCFVSRSNEVKKLGIPMGAPLFQYRDVVEKNKVRIFSGNFALYRDLSSRVMHTIHQFTDDVEIYSIDEAFVELRAGSDLTVWGKNMKKMIRQWARIPVSVGIGYTKVQAKLASHIAKVSPECAGVFDATKRNIDDFLACLPVGELWGIGRKHSAFLEAHGIETVLDFKKCDDGWVRKQLTIQGLELLHELRGTVCYPLFTNPGPAKSLVHSRSFGKTVTSLDMLRKVIMEFTSQAAEQLRSQHQVAGQLTVFIRTKRHLAEGKYVASKTVPLSSPTAFTPTLVKTAIRALDQIYTPGYAYAKAGVYFTCLGPDTSVQQSLFTQTDVVKERRLMRAVDMINERYGSATVQLAGVVGERPWQRNRNYNSPRYTTVLGEIPVVH